MSPAAPYDDRAKSPRLVIGRAIQDLVATRLGRGFLPLGLLFGMGVLQIFASAVRYPDALVVSIGALATGAAMLAYGLRISESAFGRPHRSWMSVAMFGSLVPPLYALYVLGWRGLRGFTVAAGPWSYLAAVAFTLLGLWAMRAWMKVVEVERLARVMVMHLDDKGEAA